jgi:dCTP deaminase
MILSDRDIRAELDAGHIIIDPYDERCLQPSSVDLHVDSQFRVFANSRYPFIDVREEMPDLTELVEVKPDEPFILHPGEFVLGSTLERVALPDIATLIAWLRSSGVASFKRYPAAPSARARFTYGAFS